MKAAGQGNLLSRGTVASFYCISVWGGGGGGGGVGGVCVGVCVCAEGTVQCCL